MFKMRNAIGSATIFAKTERKRDALKELGFIEVEASAEVDFEKMKVSELEAFAENKGIDLSECKNREEKLAKIKESIGE